jgi:hypothetical protein
VGIEDPTAPPRSDCAFRTRVIGLVLGVGQRERTDMTAATDLGQPVAASDDVDAEAARTSEIARECSTAGGE